MRQERISRAVLNAFVLAAVVCLVGSLKALGAQEAQPSQEIRYPDGRAVRYAT